MSVATWRDYGGAILGGGLALALILVLWLGHFLAKNEGSK